MIEKLLKAISLNDEDYTQEKENINPEFTFFTVLFTVVLISISVAGCFYVESWGVFGKLKRESGFGDSVSKSSLTIYDQISADPILVYDSDEFENVDDYKTSK